MIFLCPRSSQASFIIPGIKQQPASTRIPPPPPFLFSPSPEMAISSKQLADAQGEKVEGDWMGDKNGNPDFLCISALQEKAG